MQPVLKSVCVCVCVFVRVCLCVCVVRALRVLFICLSRGASPLGWLFFKVVCVRACVVAPVMSANALFSLIKNTNMLGARS